MALHDKAVSKPFHMLNIVTMLVFTFFLFTSAQSEETAGLPDSAREFIDRYYAAYNQGDFTTMYRDLSSPRFKSSDGFTGYEARMQSVVERLGTLISKDMTYLMADEYHTDGDFFFYRIQLNGHYDRGDSIERIVIMQRGDSWEIDGHGINVEGLTLLAQGNLYNFSYGDPDISNVFSVKSLSEQKLLKDSRTEFLENDGQAKRQKQQEAYKQFLTFAKTGDFDQAQEALSGATAASPLREIAAYQEGTLSKEGAMQFYESAYAFSFEKDIEKAIELCQKAIESDPTYIEFYISLASLQIMADKDYSSAKQTVQTALKHSPDNMMLQEILVAIETEQEHQSAQEEDEKSKAKEAGPETTPETENFSGPVKKFFPNGKLAYEVMLKDGVPDGVFKAYYNNGQLKIEGQYDSGNLDGDQNYYDSAGTLRRMTRFAQGRPVVDHHYNPDGQLLYRREVLFSRMANEEWTETATEPAE